MSRSQLSEPGRGQGIVSATLLVPALCALAPAAAQARPPRITERPVAAGTPQVERWARTGALTRIKRFEGALPAGTKLVVIVTKAGRIGKRTTIVIRRGKAPWRADRCLLPGASKAVRCPAA